MPARDSTIDRHTSDLIAPDRADDPDAGDGEADGGVSLRIVQKRVSPQGTENTKKFSVLSVSLW